MNKYISLISYTNQDADPKGEVMNKQEWIRARKNWNFQYLIRFYKLIK